MAQSMRCKTIFMVLTVPQRFRFKVYARGDCWEWRGCRGKNGYGRFGNGEGLIVFAHRYAYELAKGFLPATLVIDHLCRHPWCVKPSHLEAVTGTTNMLRGNGWSGRHARTTHCPAGHPYNADNTYRSKLGKRHCRVCDRTRQVFARHLIEALRQDALQEAREALSEWHEQ